MRLFAKHPWLVFGLGLIGTAILVYTVLGWRQPATR